MGRGGQGQNLVRGRVRVMLKPARLFRPSFIAVVHRVVSSSVCCYTQRRRSLMERRPSSPPTRHAVSSSTARRVPPPLLSSRDPPSLRRRDPPSLDPPPLRRRVRDRRLRGSPYIRRYLVGARTTTSRAPQRPAHQNGHHPMYDWHRFSCEVAETMSLCTCASTPSGVALSTSSARCAAPGTASLPPRARRRAPIPGTRLVP